MRYIKSFDEAQNIHSIYIQQYGMCFYRGHSDINFQLVPSICRHNIEGLKRGEIALFNDFKAFAQSQNWLKYKLDSYNTDFFYMSIGRHLGLDCRLLDWTNNIISALYFAVCDAKNDSSDGCIWVMQPSEVAQMYFDPFDATSPVFVKEDFLYPDDDVENVPLGIKRRMRQSGYFTISDLSIAKDPVNSYLKNGFELQNYLIPSDCKPLIREEMQKRFSEGKAKVLLKRIRFTRR